VLFNSWQFLIFMPAVFLLYYALPHRYRWILLLAASCGFYMMFIPVYILILFFTIAVDFVAGILIEGATGAWRKRYLVMSIIANVGVLAFFKYADFLNDNLDALASFLDWNYSKQALGIILPIGLSFHTFQSLSYTIEVYRGNFRAERNAGLFALYVMFFPQLVAGPIERPQNLLGQLRKEVLFSSESVVRGLRLVLWGFFMKMVVADRLALVVDTAYAKPAEFLGAASLVATACFAFQIYCDFAGYTNIAIGTARMLGIELMFNFRQPYFGRNIREFWRRWHISLSTWFRDYVYHPLGGGRVPAARRIANVAAVFLLSGLWHGANWTYVIWGGLHGIYYGASLLAGRFLPESASTPWVIRGVRRALATGLTFAAVCVAWIFFRATSVTEAWMILTHLTDDAGRWTEPSFWAGVQSALRVTTTELAVLVASLAVLVGVDLVSESTDPWRAIERFPVGLRWSLYLALALTVLNLGVVKTVPFIYFQF
jgi:alginate O-acetyltransferase complex protein AlgI